MKCIFSPKYMFYTSVYMYIFQNYSFCPRIPESHKTSYIVTSVWFVILYSLQGLCLSWLVCKSYKRKLKFECVKTAPLLLSYLDLIPGFDTTHWLCRRILNSVYTFWSSPPDLVYATPVCLPGEFHEQRSLDGLQSLGLQRVGPKWATNTCFYMWNTK